MTSPFDWRTLVLAKHAQHVALVHFPIALYLAAVAFDALAAWTRREALAQAAYWNFTAAALSVVPVLATGVIAWQWQLEGQPVKGALRYHVIAAATAALLIIAAWWLQFRARKTAAPSLPGWRFWLESLGALAVLLTGHLGGFLSGVNG